ncbi:MAG: alpha/beta hydrolase [Actinobacteria bacterium]|jgi:acetyl esterase|nr:alpha/beta hydrolase [Actinomycetota bacterium]MBT3746592.1 alpha/beta hydrolase [Actinomycetota bacterium]MBT3969132.1 alpha/beta hydrolase [Actinomycetota bacterium]MBT4010046.1 alpha/beta hydrolase [Actinomycetota bacterium]MBT4302259.1 alpha/beta hydrolase [Actinomycetota bacterium]
MPLDPALEPLLALLPSSGEDLSLVTPEMMRANYELMADPNGPAVASTENLNIPGPRGEISVRIYRPEETNDLSPVIMFFHGGGWVIGNLETHDALVRSMANETGAVVVAVDYRLAPEHPYPAAADDCYAATCWVADHADTLRVDAQRLAVAGDSAGGNLATVVALMARDKDGPAIAFQSLIYPAVDMDSDRWPSMIANAEGPLLTREAMHWFYEHYVGQQKFVDDPYAAPLRADSLAGLPPAHVTVAQYDPLCDEGLAYAEALSGAGTACEVECFDGLIHGFMSFVALVPTAAAAQQKIFAALKAGLA